MPMNFALRLEKLLPLLSGTDSTAKTSSKLFQHAAPPTIFFQVIQMRNSQQLTILFVCRSSFAPRMIFDAVDVLSGDEAPAPSASATAKLRSLRKFRSVRAKPKKKDTRSSAQKLVDDTDLLSKKLSQRCRCRRLTCCSQFLAEAKFELYRQYLARWSSLAKLDQDQIASCWQNKTARLLPFCRILWVIINRLGSA